MICPLKWWENRGMNAQRTCAAAVDLAVEEARDEHPLAEPRYMGAHDGGRVRPRKGPADVAGRVPHVRAHGAVPCG